MNKYKHGCNYHWKFCPVQPVSQSTACLLWASMEEQGKSCFLCHDADGAGWHSSAESQGWMPPLSTCNSLTLSTDDACTALLGLSTSSFLCPQIIGKYRYSHVITDWENGLCMEQEARHKTATSCIKVIFRTPVLKITTT